MGMVQQVNQRNRFASPQDMIKVARLVSLFLLLIRWSEATRLEKLCENGTAIPTDNIRDWGVNLQVGKSSPGLNLTTSTLYPLHFIGEIDEALVRVTGKASNTSEPIYVNLEPGHGGIACGYDGSDDLKMILLSGRPTASFLQVLNPGHVEIETWVALRNGELGFEKQEFGIRSSLTGQSDPPFSPISLTTADISPGLPAHANNENAKDEVGTSANQTTYAVDTSMIKVPSTSQDAVALPTKEPSVEKFQLQGDEDVATPEPIETTPSASPVVWTFAPTVTQIPTTTSSPSYSTPCHICGNPDSRITKHDATVSVFGLSVSCASLEQWSGNGHVSPTTCEEIMLPVQQGCGCQQSSTAPSPLITFPPTSTMYPTATSSPTYSKPCQYDACPTVSPKATVKVFGLAVTCKSLLWSAEKLLISPSVCDTTKEMVKQNCGCEDGTESPTALPNASPTVQPTPLTQPMTMQTDPPTYLEECDICIGTPEAKLILDGEEYLCDELRSFGLSGLVSPDVCPEAQTLAQEMCGCVTTAGGEESKEEDSPTQEPTQSDPLGESVNASKNASSHSAKGTALVMYALVVSTSFLL